MKRRAKIINYLNCTTQLFATQPETIKLKRNVTTAVKSLFRDRLYLIVTSSAFYTGSSSLHGQDLR